MSRYVTANHGRAIALACLVGCAAAACGTTAAAPVGSDRPTTASASGQTLSNAAPIGGESALIANARAAQRQRDWQAMRRFQAQLIERVGPRAISAARASYQRAVADLAAATTRGDSYARAGFRAELRAMCESGGLAGAFESCDGKIIVWGD